MATKRSIRLNAYVKYDNNGLIVPGSLLLRNKMPRGSGGTWVRINSNYCCPTGPKAPTAGVVDDTANTFNWTNTDPYTNVADYEYTLNGGTSYALATAKPIAVGAGVKAIGQVGVRVRAIGSQPAGSTLFNTVAYT